MVVAPPPSSALYIARLEPIPLAPPATPTAVTPTTPCHATRNDKTRATDTVKGGATRATIVVMMPSITTIIPVPSPMRLTTMPTEATSASIFPKTNYNLEDMNEDMLAHLNWLFSKSYKQWKSDLHQYFQQFDDPQGQVTDLTQKVAGLRSELTSYKSQMSMLVQAISSSGIHLLPAPSEPFYTEHAKQSSPSTSNLVPNPTPYQQQDYQAPQNDLPIDYSAFFHSFVPAFF
ncbi:hypothetical protein C1H46_031221 [Malus baccata]|uniref:Uncharacterized protein n=1 Tax=Malus baccata TaxID=106549 RepID=A0A540LA56_MALBA|nr:hypothetical protein C1H46_031221 [Malus baccata]